MKRYIGSHDGAVVKKHGMINQLKFHILMSVIDRVLFKVKNVRFVKYLLKYFGMSYLFSQKL